MNLPPEFISNVRGVLLEDGHPYLDALPDLIDEASARWGLRDVQPVPNLSYNFVAFANRGDRQVMLKIGLPNRETRSEMAALRLLNGEGTCKLLEHDEEKYWMLLERLSPGVMLATLEDDEEATHIAAELMKRIWVGLDTLREEHAELLDHRNNKFIQLTDWFFGGFERLRKHFDGGMGPLDVKLVERAESSVEDFFTENHHPALMHGDFHHYNILSSERGWLVIDPKGVIGPAGYEVGPFMMNPWGSFSDGDRFTVRIKRRIDILHEHLGFERERILEWSLAHAVLSAWWGIEDHSGWEYAVRFAEMVADLN